MYAPQSPFPSSFLIVTPQKKKKRNQNQTHCLLTPQYRFIHNIPLINNSCTLYHVPLNSPYETAAIHNATLLISLETNLDPRFILAIILQESSGCVRVPTSYYSVRNPGLMQDHNGPATCNEDAAPVVPCGEEVVEEMIREGSAGTTDKEGKEGMGL
ncbi:MAG: hypothetical protein Q9218_007954, partial [Villophora microphyllina]